MRKKICSIHSRWAYIFFLIVVFLIFETSIKFTFQAKEERLSQTKYKRADLSVDLPPSGSADDDDDNSQDEAKMSPSHVGPAAEAIKPVLQSVLSGTKRDLLISHEFHSGSPRGRLSLNDDKHQSSTKNSPSQSPELILSSLLSAPKELINKIQHLVSDYKDDKSKSNAAGTSSKSSLSTDSSSSPVSSSHSSSVVFPPKNAAATSTVIINKHSSAASVHRHSSPSSGTVAPTHASSSLSLSSSSPSSNNRTNVVSPTISTNHASKSRAPVKSSIVVGNATSAGVSSPLTPQNHNNASANDFVLNGSITPICPESSPYLVGMVYVNKTHQNSKAVEKRHAENVFPGGFYRPHGCLPRHRVAIVVPFRDRAQHLNIFLNHMMPFLKKQQLEFAIYIVELVPKETFNRAMLMNIGFREALKDREWQCFVFHDVDLLPENDRNVYSCPTNPRHMSAAVDTMDYKLPYKTIFGGVSAFSKVHFELINGFSNAFFGWGGEDDDLYHRTVKKGLKVTRYPMKIARYTMLKHVKDKPNPDRYKYLREGTRRMADDGINKLSYKLIRTERHKLYTKILVSIDEKAVKSGIQVKKKKARKA